MKAGDLVKLKELTHMAGTTRENKEVMGMLIEPPSRKSIGWATILWFNDGFVSHNKGNFEMVKK